MRFKVPRSFYIPKGSVRVTDKATGAEAYIRQSPAPRERFYAVGFIGKQCKPVFNYSFRTAAAREQHVREFFAGQLKRQNMMASRRVQQNAPHTLKVGAIIVNSWGYDQTNVDWYAVVRTTEHYVWLRKIEAEAVRDGGISSMAGTCTVHIDCSNPNPSTWGVRFIGEDVTKHKASGKNVTMRHGTGNEWDGRPRYESWYA